MSILQKLTVRHLAQNRRRTLITVIGIVLSVAMVTAVAGLVASFQDLLYRDSVAREGLWHVRYSGVSEETQRQVVAEPVFSEWEIVTGEEGERVLSLQFSRLHRGIFDESEAVCHQYGIDAEQVRYNNNLLIAKGIVPGPYYDALYTFAAILLALVGVGSVLVISNAFTISADQRSVQFGLLKSAGATKRQIRGMVLFEGVLLALCAIPLGILAGIFVEWVALRIANSILGPMAAVNLTVEFHVIVSLPVLALPVAAALLTVLLAAWLPARRAGRVSAVEAIRQTKSIRLSARSVRVSPLVARMFGFEGMLAAKTLRRNRGKYRSTILALVVSIVLFIGVSSFGSILLKATSMVYEDLGSNVAITMRGDAAELHDRLAGQLAGMEGVQIFPTRNIAGTVTLPDNALTADYLQYFGEDERRLCVHSIGDEAFAALCADLRVDSGETGGDASLRGILVNTTGTYIQSGRRISFAPYRVSGGMRVPAVLNGQPYSLEITATIGDIPAGTLLNFQSASFNVIVSDQTMKRLWQGEDFLWAAAYAEDAENFAERARALLEERLPFHTWSVFEYEKMAANNRNISALVMTFVYGFIALLSLIGVTSVIATISTGIALRKREFAMLRSVGMTEPAIARMLRYESLLYGAKALAWGIPLGLLACVLLYRAMTSVMDFPFIWPVQSVAISVVAVLLLTFTTMTFARRKQRRINIVGALRDDVI